MKEPYVVHSSCCVLHTGECDLICDLGVRGCSMKHNAPARSEPRRAEEVLVADAFGGHLIPAPSPEPQGSEGQRPDWFYATHDGLAKKCVLLSDAASALSACEEKLRGAEASEAEAIAHWNDRERKLDDARIKLADSERKREEAVGLLRRVIAHAPIVAIQDVWDAEAFLAAEPKGQE